MSNGQGIRKQAPIEPGELKQILQALHNDVLEDVDNKLQKGIDRIVTDFQFKNRKPQNDLKEKSSLTKESGRPKQLPPKEFISRNSILTDFWENAEMLSLYNCVFSVFILMYLYISIFYYLHNERLKQDLAILAWTFGKFHIVTATLVAINLSIVYLLYPSFRFWSTKRIFAKNKGLFDSTFCTLFILYEAAVLMIPAGVMIVYNLPPISSFIVSIEQLRLFMKSYAFVRENTTKALKYKPHQDGDKKDSDSYTCPKVEKLVYFLFAPTLVYRDNYPRTFQRIRWSYVALNILGVFWCILVTYIVLVFFGAGTFNKAGIELISFDYFVGALAVSVLGGVILLFASFYSTFHCWSNAFAEMLKFGDRMFYDDWWNCTSFAKYLRSWNLLVYDWLYFYIYQDMYIVLGRSRTGAMLTVLLLSAIFHEYILAVCLRFVCPLLFIFFAGFGVLLAFLTRKATSRLWNVFFWCSLFQGFGFLIVFYTLEWYARINCPRTIDSWQDYFVPRTFNCSVISFAS